MISRSLCTAASRGRRAVTAAGGAAGSFPRRQHRWLSAASSAHAAKKDDIKSELELNLKPSEVVSGLDAHIVGQHDAKRAVAIAMRNRWRRKQLPDELRKEVTPRNVLLVGPTGCGKTEG